MSNWVSKKYIEEVRAVTNGASTDHNTITIVKEFQCLWAMHYTMVPTPPVSMLWFCHHPTTAGVRLVASVLMCPVEEEELMQVLNWLNNMMLGTDGVSASILHAHQYPPGHQNTNQCPDH